MSSVQGFHGNWGTGLNAGSRGEGDKATMQLGLQQRRRKPVLEGGLCEPAPGCWLATSGVTNS